MLSFERHVQHIYLHFLPVLMRFPVSAASSTNPSFASFSPYVCKIFYITRFIGFYQLVKSGTNMDDDAMDEKSL